jgi:hypothetical protein
LQTAADVFETQRRDALLHQFLFCTTADEDKANVGAVLQPRGGLHDLHEALRQPVRTVV